MTFVALVCDVPEVQRVLPQIIIGNFHTLRASDMAALRAKLPGNVVLLRQRSAWNNNHCPYGCCSIGALRAHLPANLFWTPPVATPGGMSSLRLLALVFGPLLYLPR